MANFKEFEVRSFKSKQNYLDYYQNAISHWKNKIFLCGLCSKKGNVSIKEPSQSDRDSIWNSKKMGILPNINNEFRRSAILTDKNYYCRDCLASVGYKKTYLCFYCKKEQEYPFKKELGQKTYYPAYRLKGEDICCYCFSIAVTPKEFKDFTWDKVRGSFCTREVVEILEVWNKTRTTAFIGGPAGIGKTTLSYLLQRDLLKNNEVYSNPTKAPIYLHSINKVIAEYNNAPFKAEEGKLDKDAILKKYKELDYLILDDLIFNEKSADVLFLILNYRYENKLPTFFNSNKSFEDLDKIDMRLSDRILKFVGKNLFWCEGTSFRVNQKIAETNQKQLEQIKETAKSIADSYI